MDIQSRAAALWVALTLLSSGAIAQESPYLYGIHDHDTGQQEFLDHLNAQGVTGWVTATVAIGSNPNDTGGDDFRGISSQGHAVICRLNNGYGSSGTIPVPARYDDFARRCANFVAASRGCSIFIIGNETNLAAEWPVEGGRSRYVSPQDYANCFRLAYQRIKAVRPDVKVLCQALAPFAGPYGAGTIYGVPHDPMPLSWTSYMRQMLEAIKASGGIDGIALHINSRGYSYNDIHSGQQVNGQSFSFGVYRDWVELGTPPDLYHLPLYATECNGIYYWSGGHPERPNAHYEAGWMQEIYAEIDRYNQSAAASGRPVYRCVNMYRWCRHCDGWNIDGSPYKGQILSDLDQAISARYRWPGGGSSPPPPPPPPPPPSSVPPGSNVATGAAAWQASSNFNGSSAGDKAFDGQVSAGSKWTSDGSSRGSWLALDLGQTRRISGFVVHHAGAGGEPAYFNTEALRLETGPALGGPWSRAAELSNGAQQAVSSVTLANPVDARCVRLVIHDAGIDDYARIPELEVYATGGAAPPPPPPPPSAGGNLLQNADFAGGLNGWTPWTERGRVRARVEGGALKLGGSDAHNGGVYQRIATGGAGARILVSGRWASDPTRPQQQWGELLVINGSRVPRNGQDVEASQADVELLCKNDTWASPGGWSGDLAGTSPVIQHSSFVATGDVATLVLKSGSTGSGSGTRFDDLDLRLQGAPPPPPPPGAGTPPPGRNVALQASGWWASSVFGPTFAGERAFDGRVSVASKWTSDGSSPDSWLVLDLGRTHAITGFVVQHASAAGESEKLNTRAFRLETGPTQGGPWTVAASVDNSAMAASSAMTLGMPVSARFVRLAIRDAGIDNYARIPEFEVYAQGAGTPPPAPGPSSGAGLPVRAVSIPAGQSIPDYQALRQQLQQQGRDLAFMKIGFHVGPGGNQTGLSQWMRELDAVGVPFVLKSADSAGQILEAAQLRAASGVPHVLVYRKSVGSGWNPDVPDYALAPRQAAAEHWQRHRAAFPPELEPYKDLIWLETINEVDKNRAEWLAEFALETAQLALAEGFNWAAFGWSSGEPERTHWEGPKMQEFLRLAGGHPERLAVALHEYSYVTTTLQRDFPYLVGRFQSLFAGCDDAGIPRPTVLVTEFGWAYAEVAPVAQAMDVDLPWAAELYAGYPRVLGAAIWYLGPGFLGVSDQTQRLIAPLVEAARRSYFELGPPGTR